MVMQLECELQERALGNSVHCKGTGPGMGLESSGIVQLQRCRKHRAALGARCGAAFVVLCSAQGAAASARVRVGLLRMWAGQRASNQRLEVAARYSWLGNSPEAQMLLGSGSGSQSSRDRVLGLISYL